MRCASCGDETLVADVRIPDALSALQADSVSLPRDKPPDAVLAKRQTACPRSARLSLPPGLPTQAWMPLGRTTCPNCSSRCAEAVGRVRPYALISSCAAGFVAPWR